MRFELALPPSVEVADSGALESGGVQFTPNLVRGQAVMRVAYIKALGANGTESLAILSFNGRTGQFQLSSPAGKVATLPFDRPAAEFQKLRAKQSESGKKGGKKSSG